MKKSIPEIQVGKNGLTEGTIGVLKNTFKTHEDVKVSILKSVKRDKEMVENIAKEIIDKLGVNYTYRIVGFTIAIKKWRKARR